ncbi:MAG: hypothetical protein QNI95_20960 [Desulfobacterales bacterium]|nr:hypothetical protein [Desulfobacterales bacterium]
MILKLSKRPAIQSIKGEPVILIQTFKSMRIIGMIIFLTSMGTLLLPQVSQFFRSSAMIGVRSVAASSHYGILGQKAPEIYLNSWIDENGAEIAPIRLIKYRGKVVYLYFFQDW